MYLFATRRRKDIFLKRYQQITVTGAGADHKNHDTETLWQREKVTLRKEHFTGLDRVPIECSRPAKAAL